MMSRIDFCALQDTVRCTLALLDHLVAQIASAASFDGATEN